MAVLQECDIVCGWCGGYGHKTEKCSTPYLLREKAKMRGCAWNLGALKGCCWNPNDPDTVVVRLERKIGRLEAWRKANGFKKRLF